MAEKGRCDAITGSGTRCKGIAIDGAGGLCHAHHPDRAEQRKRHASKGGRRAGRGRPVVELADIKDRIRAMVEDVRGGGMDRADAAVCGQLYNTLIRAVSVELRVREQQELEGRIEELERLLERHGEGGRSRWG
jgi:hypothetical protein